jgi:hypothetical protein
VHHTKKHDIKVLPPVERGGRGRPRKHPHPAAQSKGEVSLNEVSDSEESGPVRLDETTEIADRALPAAHDESKRGRGRPKKLLAGATPSKQQAQVGGRGRGRPRKGGL